MSRNDGFGTIGHLTKRQPFNGGGARDSRGQQSEGQYLPALKSESHHIPIIEQTAFQTAQFSAISAQFCFPQNFQRRGKDNEAAIGCHVPRKRIEGLRT